MSSTKSTPAPQAAVLHPDTAVALAFVQRLAESGFWGNISLKLEDGRVTHVRQEENFKPSELSGIPR
jgi:hypothetical protein